MTTMKNITVVGAGYVGLANACLLSRKNNVTILETSWQKVLQLNNAISPISDKEIQACLCENIGKSLRATIEKDEAYNNTTDMVVIAVPTNYDEDTNYFDTSIVESVIADAEKLCPNALKVVKSTLPIGFVDRMVEKGYQNLFFSPEFLREGSALKDCLNPDRIIVGTSQDEYKAKAEYVCSLFLECTDKQDTPTLVTGAAEAEAVKLFANSYLAMRVAFFNELDTYAIKKGLCTEQILKGVCLDKRIGEGYNNPSFGYGGYCFPKDTKQLLANYEGIPQKLVRAIVEANPTRKMAIVNDIYNKIKNSENTAVKVGIYRIAMKAGSDNYRMSASIDIAEKLQALGIDVVIYEDASIFPYGNINEIPVVHHFDLFAKNVDIIVANRIDDRLEQIKKQGHPEIYSRDVYNDN